MLTSRDKKIADELKQVTGRLAEDLMYQLVLDEIERSDLDPVAKVQALEEAEGDEAKANAFYPKHRIRRIQDFIKVEVFEAETELLKEKAKEAQRAKAVEAEKKIAWQRLEQSTTQQRAL